MNEEKSFFRYGKVINIISQKLKNLGDENLAKHDITLSQLKVLATVSRADGEGICQRDLEKSLGVSAPSVTSILQNMERSGIIERRSKAQDARTKGVFLTEKGKMLDESLRDYLRTLDEIAVKGFSDEDKENFRRLLAMSLNNLESE